MNKEVREYMDISKRNEDLSTYMDPSTEDFGSTYTPISEDFYTFMDISTLYYPDLTAFMDISTLYESYSDYGFDSDKESSLEAVTEEPVNESISMENNSYIPIPQES